MPKTVLLIEDDAAVAQLFQDVLEAEGFEVRVEVDGERGLNAFDAEPPDLALIDLLLPKLKGFELIDRLRKSKRGRDVPIVVISGVYPSISFKKEMIEKHRIVEFLDKPVDIDRLIDVLHDVFSSAYPEAMTTADVGEQDPSEKGDLTTIPFATALGRLYRRRASGALMLRKASVKKIVYLRDGVPIFVKSNLLAECLGRIMVQERLISQEECDESLERKKKEKKRQGEILVAMGSISQHNLDFALELQMQTKLFDMFSWLEGRYQFNDQGEYTATQVALPLAPAALIYEGASRAMSSDRIARELAKIADARLVPGDPSFRYQTLQLEPRAEKLVDRVDGTRTLGHLLDEAEFERADAALLLYTLWCTGLIETAEDARAISLGDQDVEVLSTGEINAIALIAHVDDSTSGPNWDKLEALIDASTEEALDPVTEPPMPILERWTDPAPIFAEDPVEEPLEGATEEAFSTDVLSHISIDEAADTFQSDPALFPRSSPGLPREVRWTAARSAPVPRRESDTDDSNPQLSEEIRRQVRDRLEAHVARITEERASERPRPSSSTTRKFPTRPSATSTYRLRAPPKDVDKERRLESELSARLDLMERQTYYELLEVAEDARVELIRTAYHALARKHDPERVAGHSTSRVAHKKAEQIYLLVTRALGTLTNDRARAEYDRKIGLTQIRQADLIAAATAFDLGMTASARGDWRAAKELFEHALRLDREEGVYLAHLGWAYYQGDGNEARALELLDRAAERTPRTEEVHIFTAQIHEKAGRKAEAISAYQRALACNSDCIRALEALKILDPPSNKRSGLIESLRSLVDS